MVRKGMDMAIKGRGEGVRAAARVAVARAATVIEGRSTDIIIEQRVRMVLSEFI